MIGEEKLDRDFVEQTQAVRLNNSSTQVYMALKPGEEIDESSGDLFFTSTSKEFRTDLLLSRDVTSRTFSFYYPRTRPTKKERFAIVSSTNANWSDWSDLSDEEYAASKQDLVETTIDALEKYIPGVRRQDRSSRSGNADERSNTTRCTNRVRVSGPSLKGLAVSRSSVAADQRDVSRRQRRHHHERLVGRDQLRRYRQQ